MGFRADSGKELRYRRLRPVCLLSRKIMLMIRLDLRGEAGPVRMQIHDLVLLPLLDILMGIMKLLEVIILV